MDINVDLLYRNKVENLPWYFLFPLLFMLWILCFGMSGFIVFWLYDILKDYLKKGR